MSYPRSCSGPVLWEVTTYTTYSREGELRSSWRKALPKTELKRIFAQGNNNNNKRQKREAELEWVPDSVLGADFCIYFLFGS